MKECFVELPNTWVSLTAFLSTEVNYSMKSTCAGNHRAHKVSNINVLHFSQTLYVNRPADHVWIILVYNCWSLLYRLMLPAGDSDSVQITDTMSQKNNFSVIGRICSLRLQTWVPDYWKISNSDDSDELNRVGHLIKLITLPINVCPSLESHLLTNRERWVCGRQCQWKTEPNSSWPFNVWSAGPVYISQHLDGCDQIRTGLSRQYMKLSEVVSKITVNCCDKVFVHCIFLVVKRMRELKWDIEWFGIEGTTKIGDPLSEEFLRQN